MDTPIAARRRKGSTESDAEYIDRIGWRPHPDRQACRNRPGRRMAVLGELLLRHRARLGGRRRLQGPLTTPNTPRGERPTRRIEGVRV